MLGACVALGRFSSGSPRAYSVVVSSTPEIRTTYPAGLPVEDALAGKCLAEPVSRAANRNDPVPVSRAT